MRHSITKKKSLKKQTEERKHLLVVDDSRLIQDQLTRELTEVGYDVHAVGRGVDAIRYYAEKKPDIIILDCLLPLLSGFVVCEQIRNIGGDHRPVIIMISGVYTRSRYRTEAKKYGADEFMIKPVTGAEIKATIEKFSISRAVPSTPAVPKSPFSDERKPALVTLEEFQFCLGWASKMQNRKKMFHSVIVLECENGRRNDVKSHLLKLCRESDVITGSARDSRFYLLLMDAGRNGVNKFLARLNSVLSDELTNGVRVGTVTVSPDLKAGFPHSLRSLEMKSLKN